MKHVSEFVDREEKADSLSTGFIGKLEGETYILKEFLSKSEISYEVQERGPRREALAEGVSSLIYKEILGERAPDIEFVRGDDGKAYLSSKFFHDFKTLSELTDGKDGSALGEKRDEIAKIEGFEKVIAACLVCGEVDIHAGNIGVVPSEDGKLVAVKIDHGRTTYLSLQSYSLMLDSLSDRFGKVGYRDFKFDVSVLRTELEKASSITKDRFSELVGAKISEAKEAGFEISSISMERKGEGKKTFGEMHDPDLAPMLPQKTYVRGKGHVTITEGRAVPEEKRAEFEEGAYLKASETFSSFFDKQAKVCRELCSVLEIVEKMQEPSKDWKKGAWLKDLEDKDPISFAIDNDLEIDGKNPIIWCRENRKDLEEKGIYPFGKDDPVQYYKKNDIEIGGKSVDKYCEEKGIPTIDTKTIGDTLRSSLSSQKHDAGVQVGRIPESRSMGKA